MLHRSSHKGRSETAKGRRSERDRVVFAVVATIMSGVLGTVMAGWRGTLVGGSLGALLGLLLPPLFSKLASTSRS